MHIIHSAILFLALQASIMSLSATVIDLTQTLTTSQGFRVTGYGAYDYLGGATKYAGDLNKDAIPDVIIGASGANYLSRSGAGVIYVIYGKADSTISNINVNSIPSSEGFSIYGNNADAIGSSFIFNADYNNDGHKDLVIAAPGTGKVYIIYGTANPFTDIDLATPSSYPGTTITGANFNLLVVSWIGDINGDTFDDLAIGIPNDDNSGRSGNGAIYVIYGGPNFANNIDITNNFNSANGFRVLGASDYDNLGTVVAYAGDVNGDSIKDITFSLPLAPPSGLTYVLYGLTGVRGDIDLSTSLTQSQGFKITGAINAKVGDAVSTAGDVNQDGAQDIIIGAASAGNYDGAAYIIYGKNGGNIPDYDLNTDLTLSQGFKVTCSGYAGSVGTLVSYAGDVNKDGVDDVLIGAQAVEYGPPGTPGIYVVYGKSGGGIETVDFNPSVYNPFQGFFIAGSSAFTDVSFLKDFNKGGTDDIVIGSSTFDAQKSSMGAAWVLYFGIPSFLYLL